AQAVERQQPLAARWTGKAPERNFEATRLPGVDDNTLLELLTQKGVVFSGRAENDFWRSLLLGWVLPIGGMMLLWSFKARRMMQGGASPLMLGKNRARIYSEQDIRVR